MMDTMKKVILGESQKKKIVITNVKKFFLKGRRCLEHILLNSIPTYLSHTVLNFFERGKLQKSYQKDTHPRKTSVYDVLNAKNGSKFVVNDYLICHNSGYGMGAKKMWSDLVLAGKDVTLNQCRGYLQDYWKLFSGVKRFEAQLEMEWNKNDGWIYNGYGRPLAIDDDKIKDIVNRFVQSTATDVLMVYCMKLYNNLNNAGIEWIPFLTNLHDETIQQIREDQVDLALDIYKQTMVELNSELNWDVELKGDPEVGKTLSDFKIED